MNFNAGLNAVGGFFQAIFGNLPPLLAALAETAETVFPNAKSGAQKLDFVVNATTAYLGKIGIGLAAAEGLVPILTQAINNIVAAAKAVPTAVNAPISVPPAINPPAQS